MREGIEIDENESGVFNKNVKYSFLNQSVGIESLSGQDWEKIKSANRVLRIKLEC